MRTLSTLCFAFLLLSCSTPATKTGDSDRFAIPFQKHVLSNGLTVLIHEDHSDPVVHVDVTYHVGSARERLGRSGFAHLFEHMMFQGSEHVADEEHFHLVTEAGGTLNGSTYPDRTEYYETVPSNHLEEMLWLEADRMGFFLDGITEKKFEVQRATVKNEKAQNYDNRAYGRAQELIAKALYPYGHPYSWIPIGDVKDLDAANAEDLRQFFLRWYGPNNAVLAIGGDVDPKAVMAMVEKYFGGIERGPEVKKMAPAPATLERDRYVSYYDDKIRWPAVTFSFPTVPEFDADEPALNCLAEILGGGKDSYLYQNLVASRKAINASAYENSGELAGQFFMFVLPYPGKSLADFEQELRDTLTQFETNGVTDEDIQKYKAQYERRLISQLETVSGKTSSLAFYQTIAGDANYFSTNVRKNLAITKEDVMRVYNKYIKDKPAVILSILANPNGQPAKADNYTIPTSGDNPYAVPDPHGLKYVKAKDNFDRSIKPQPGIAKPVHPPQYWTAQSTNGSRIIGSDQTDLPEITLTFSMKGGQALDSLNLSKLGLAYLTTEMLNTSTAHYSEKEFADELEKIGASIDFQVDDSTFNVTLTTLTKNVDKAAQLLQERLFNPAFKHEDFIRVQKQIIEEAQSETKQASSIAPMVYNRILYGDHDVRGIPDTEVVKTLPTLSEEDCKNFFERYFTPKNAILVAVGDLPKEDVLKKFNFLLQWQKGEPAQPVFDSEHSLQPNVLYFVNKTGAPQSEIRVGYLTDLKYDLTGDFFKANLMNFPLGGAFNSRINLNLREDKAVTYGAWSYFDSSEIPGPFTVSASVKADGTELAVREIIKELDKYSKQGISDEELQFMRSSVEQRDALKYESPRQKVGFLYKLLRYNADKDFVEQQKKIISSIGKDEIDALAKKYVSPEQMDVLVVGDKATVLPGLKKLPYKIVELDETGANL